MPKWVMSIMSLWQSLCAILIGSHMYIGLWQGLFIFLLIAFFVVVEVVVCMRQVQLITTTGKYGFNLNNSTCK